MATFTHSQWTLFILVLFPFLQGVGFLAFRKLPLKSLPTFASFSSLCSLFAVVFLTQLADRDLVTQLSLPWLPEVFVYFSLRADGLGLFFSLLITSMGALVFWYAKGYMDHSESSVRKFYAYLSFFMGSMLGAVLADNMILLFLFWESTSVVSFLLISYEHHKPEARQASRMAFLLNGLASLALLLGLILMGILDQTFELSQIEKIGLIYAEHPAWIFSIIALLMVGIYAKSAQFPFHFWLPQAMAAPTPVSAYLHSATMVKLGVYLTARVYGLFVDCELWFPLVSTFSLVTVLVGGVWALFAQKLKQVLAFATVSQLGFFISFYGIGDPIGLNYDYVHIFSHALYKGSLFMIVGILTHSASITHIHQLPGVTQKLPFLSGIMAIALAAMAGIPGTVGFLSKELIIADLVSLLSKEPMAIFVFLGLTLGLLLKVAFTYRLFYYGFLKSAEHLPVVKTPPSFSLLFPPLFLSLIALALGVWPQGLEKISKSFFIEGLHAAAPPSIYLWHGFSTPLLISCLIFTGGIGLFYLTRSLEQTLPVEKIPGFKDGWLLFLDQAPHLALRLTRIFHRSHPTQHLFWILGIWVALLAPLVFWGVKEWPTHASFQLPQACASLIALCSLSIPFVPSLFHKLILLCITGFLVMFQFVLQLAPDVAMTQMLIEVATLFVVILLFKSAGFSQTSQHCWLRASLALVTGCLVAMTPLFHGSMSSSTEMGSFFMEQALPLAKGKNAVNTILVDFRALDTLGEVAVIVVAALAVMALLLKKERCTIRHPSSLIPTPIFSLVLPQLCLVTVALGLFLLLRGHNYPGGGFSGGMAPAIAFVLLLMTVKESRLFLFDHLSPFLLMFSGLALAFVTAILPLFWGEALFTAYFSEQIPALNTPLMFDLGIFFLVVGSVIAMVHVIRERTLWESAK